MCRSEAEIFAALGLPYKEPWERNVHENPGKKEKEKGSGCKRKGTEDYDEIDMEVRGILGVPDQINGFFGAARH